MNPEIEVRPAIVTSIKYTKGMVAQGRQDLRDFSMEGKVFPFQLLEGRSITVGRSGVGICTQSKGFISWTREEAVAAARVILEYYGEGS